MDFQGFLNDLQDWELSLKDKDAKMKSQAPSERIDGDRRTRRKNSAMDSSRSHLEGYDGSSHFDSTNHLSSRFVVEESTVDATSEKELGNEFFKLKKFKEAIDCYSRSIALTPTAVAYANRAMAYLKIRRFPESEDDCTEALNLDDRYVKAYSRRATARKELGKLKESIEDFELAMMLEPNNQETKKLYAEVKSLYEKRASAELRSSMLGAKKGVSLKTNGSGLEAHPVPAGTQRTGLYMAKKDKVEDNDENVLIKKNVSVEEIDNRCAKGGRTTNGEVNSCVSSTSSSRVEHTQTYHIAGRQELKASVQELASRAASCAMAEAARSIKPPKSAYEFELSWRGFSDDCALQARLLKVTSPSALPQILKNALSAPMLMDIIKCIATFFVEDMDLAIEYLINLTKVPRFNMLIMCLSSMQRADLAKLWDDVFCSEATAIKYAEILDSLRPKYLPK
uniref:RNA polymerase II-associated protein 3 isoform X3 n=1 Tax=Rhizophora mucronata TaxID=61149 RepID=A0A2P2L401_RHIMU